MEYDPGTEGNNLSVVSNNVHVIHVVSQRLKSHVSMGPCVKVLLLVVVVVLLSFYYFYSKHVSICQFQVN